MRKIVLIIVIIGIVGAIGYLELLKSARHGGVSAPGKEAVAVPESARSGAPASSRAVIIAEKEKQFPRAKEIAAPSGFINTGAASAAVGQAESGQGKPITIGELIGKKVILVDFWTYSCINCQRTIPYLNQWYEKYRDSGLEIIGVHTPEFGFEKEYENVAAAVKRFGVKYPVVLDNDQGTWDAYGNQYWPREYLIDIDGFIVHDRAGEGDYEDTEARIQSLLSERMVALGVSGSAKASAQAAITKPSNATDVQFGQVQSPEVYFGAARNEYLGNGTAHTGGVQDFIVPAASSVSVNQLYLAGKWNVESEFAENTEAGAKIIFRYKAKNVYFVAGSKNGARITVLIDGKPVGAQAGGDVAKGGTAAIKDNRLYELIKGTDYGEHTLEIIIKDPRLQAFTFTFG